MGLTSGFFLDVVIGAVIALPLATILLWSRVRGPRQLRNGLRVLMIGLCQGCAVLLAGLLINNSFQLYTSWSDLLGDNGGPGAVQGDQQIAGDFGTGAAAQLGSQGRTSGIFRPDGRPAEYQATVTGARSKVTTDVTVWLPPQYFSPAYAHARFPVIELLSGFPGTPGSWFLSLQAPNMMSSEILALRARPAILVGPNINVARPHNPDCSNIPHGVQAATWLTRDVRDLIDSSFRAIASRDGWGLMGYSEGGLCASKLALQYPDMFAAGVSMSGDDHPDGDLLQPGTALYDQNSPLWLLKNRPARPVSLLLTGTLQDGSTAAEADAMIAAAKAPTSIEKLIAPRGGHNAGVWKAAEPVSLDWLADRLAAIQLVPGTQSTQGKPGGTKDTAAGAPVKPTLAPGVDGGGADAGLAGAATTTHHG
ncbi:MAG: alpha/beta hydrolase [Actinocrinis sp.]